MIRVNILLVLAVLITAFVLVHTQYQSRRLYATIDKAQSYATELDIEHDSLNAQRRTAATAERVQRVAKEALNMRAPSPADTLYLQPKPLDGGQP